jgi:DNA replication protein DnaC
VSEHQTVLVTGATGTGKSYFGCALAHKACRKSFRALYRRVPRLFDELRPARADGTYSRLLARIAKIVLVLDDFANAPLTDKSRRDLLEILDDRYGLRATVISLRGRSIAIGFVFPFGWVKGSNPEELREAVREKLAAESKETLQN